MRIERFHAMVERLTIEARERADHYRTRLALVALLGYAYVGLILVACVAVLVGLGWMLLRLRVGGAMITLGKVTVPFMVLAGVILRALWVRFEPPWGVPLRREAAPALDALARDVVRHLKAPRFHEILLTAEFNAAAFQTPRLGFFGWHRNALVLGLPLMEALSPDEFRAVLTHEIGHLSRQHGRFGAWIFRVRAMWERVTQELEARQHWGRQVFTWFLDWWGPYFNAFSFVLARQHEYEADRSAADLFGRETMGSALLRLEVFGTFVERQFWEPLHASLEASPEPPERLIEDLAAVLAQGPSAADAQEWASTAFRRRTDLADTHPSLTDRLKALDVSPARIAAAAARPVEVSAATHYLAGALPAFRSQVQAAWRVLAAPSWAAQRKARLEARSWLQGLNKRAESGSLPEQLAWKRADLTLQLDGAKRAEPLLREIVEQLPNHAAANWNLGHLLMERNDDAGIPLIEHAVDLDPTARAAGYEVLRRYSERRGRDEEANRYRQLMWKALDS
jgi:Zn-dependent protease with chaperone function